jgi:NDP-sugar pyrophosphorylase family protein
MIKIAAFVNEFSVSFPEQLKLLPWEFTGNISEILTEKIARLGKEFEIKNEIAIHKTATIEKGAVLKGPVIIGENCFVAANAYLRDGVYLGKSVVIGPSCEIKSSLIFSNTCIAHFNFIGDSIIGSDVNFEAGAVIANHYNERKDKRIHAFYEMKNIDTQSEKFGALVGDHSKIGANAVLSPGTLLLPNTTVKRLELIDQNDFH